MADETIDQRFKYTPNRTLGRSGFIDRPAGQLSTRIRHLDALLVLITSYDGDLPHFLQLNDQVQAATLDLAASLAKEVHELHEELLLEDLRICEESHRQKQEAGLSH